MKPQPVLWYISNDVIHIVELPTRHLRTRTVYWLCLFEKYEELRYNVKNAVEIYQNLPCQNQLEAKEAVMSGKVSDFAEFSSFMVHRRLQDKEGDNMDL